MLADYATMIDEHQVWLTMEDNQCIGVLILIPNDGYMLLDNIAVHPDAQGKGLGRRLLDLADREAAHQGYSELRLYTHVMMTENIEIYQRSGWEETGRGVQDRYKRVFFRRPVSPN